MAEWVKSEMAGPVESEMAELVESETAGLIESEMAELVESVDGRGPPTAGRPMRAPGRARVETAI